MPAEMLPTVTYFATLLGFGVLVTGLSRRVNIPEAVFMLLVGLAFSPTFFNLVDINLMGDIPEFLRTLALIIIVFASSFHLKLDTFKKVSNISLKMSFGGFFFTMFFMALCAHFIFGLSTLGSLLLGSIVGGTSSAAIYTFRGALEKEKHAFDILTVESIFTDPLTVLVPVLLLSAITGGVTSGTFYISQFWQMIAAGVGTGVVIGFAAVEVFKHTQRELSPILSFAIAMITYAMASNVGGSGILAVALCAMILGNLKIPHKEIIGEFEDSLSIMLTISVFTLLGAQISLSFGDGLLFKEIIFLAILIFFARPVLAILSLAKTNTNLPDTLLIAFTGPRGVASAAMAAIPVTFALRENIEWLIPEAELILLTTFMVILFTMLSSTIVGFIFSRIGSSAEEQNSN
ncbi:MAG: cation:proton antiporter [archaeon]